MARQPLGQMLKLRRGPFQLQLGQVGAVGQPGGAHAGRQLPGGRAVVDHHGMAVMHGQHAARLPKDGIEGARAPVR